jgi:hypothetical protein
MSIDKKGNTAKTDLNDESPNKQAVAEKISVDGSNLLLKRQSPGSNPQTEIIAVPLSLYDEDKESYRQNLAMDSVIVRKTN